MASQADRLAKETRLGPGGQDMITTGRRDGAENLRRVTMPDGFLAGRSPVKVRLVNEGTRRMTNTDQSPAVSPATERQAVPRWHLHRRMYDWVLHWADTPYGAIALFCLSFAESSFFPVPPDVLLIALVLGSRGRWFRFAAICTLASVLGGVAGYGIGLAFMDTIGAKIIAFYHAESYYGQVTEWYQQYDYWIVFIASLTPIPYKVFTIASGAFHMNLLGFVLVSIVGRGMRFFAVAALLYLFGPPMKRFIDRYFNLLCVVFVILLVGGFAAIKFIR